MARHTSADGIWRPSRAPLAYTRELVTRLVRLGLLDVDRDRSGAPWFDPAALSRLARIQRLRNDFSVNYAAVGLVLDLLDRVDALENALRGQRYSSRAAEHDPWTWSA